METPTDQRWAPGQDQGGDSRGTLGRGADGGGVSAKLMAGKCCSALSPQEALQVTLHSTLRPPAQPLGQPSPSGFTQGLG